MWTVSIKTILLDFKFKFVFIIKASLSATRELCFHSNSWKWSITFYLRGITFKNMSQTQKLRNLLSQCIKHCMNAKFFDNILFHASIPRPSHLQCIFTNHEYKLKQCFDSVFKIVYDKQHVIIVTIISNILPFPITIITHLDPA